VCILSGKFVPLVQTVPKPTFDEIREEVTRIAFDFIQAKRWLMEQGVLYASGGLSERRMAMMDEAFDDGPPPEWPEASKTLFYQRKVIKTKRTCAHQTLLTCHLTPRRWHRRRRASERALPEEGPRTRRRHLF